jgi:hypothetical protein
MGFFQSWVDITFVLLNRHWIPGLEAMLSYLQLKEPVEGTWREPSSSGICPCLRIAEFRPPIRLTWRLASTLAVCALSAWPLLLMLVLWLLGLYFECLFLGSLSLCALDVGLYGLGVWPHCSSSGEYSSFLFFCYLFFLFGSSCFFFCSVVSFVSVCACCWLHLIQKPPKIEHLSI